MTNDKPIRSYCHPVDRKIIRKLDTPIVTSVFKKIIGVETELNWGPMIAGAIPVTEKNFPWINAIIEQCADTLNIPKPYVVISNSVGMNAYTVGVDDNAYIILGAPLVKVMENHKKHLHFVIGHECGHIAMGHLIYNSIVNAISNAALNGLGGNVKKLLTPPLKLALYSWSRRSEISADRAGLLCCGDLDAAQHALAQVEMGFLSIENIDISDYLNAGGHYRKSGVLRKMGEYLYSHPLLPKRIEALEIFVGSELIYRLVGIEPPDYAIDNEQMEQSIEELLKVA